MAKTLKTNVKVPNNADNKKKYRFAIGIDPDVEASGFAVWDIEKKEFQFIEQLKLWDLFGKLKAFYFDSIIRLEAGHKINSTWHKGGNGMAKRVGANHEIGRQIEKFMKLHKMNFDLVAPCGYSSFNHERFCQVTKWDKKVLTNPEKRVAGLLVYGYG